MKTNLLNQSFAANVFQMGLAAMFLAISSSRAQTPEATRIEQVAPALPADLAELGGEAPASEAPAAGGTVELTEVKSGAQATPVTDYTTQIGDGLKERERRLTLLNEAMMKLREAGETEDAGRIEERIRALLEMPAPSQAGTKMRAEIDQLRAKNDDLALQLLAAQEELKRTRGGLPTSTRKTVASSDR